MTRFLARFWAAVAYLTCIVAANWLTTHYGLWPVGFGLAATAGTYAAGAALVTRNHLQDVAGRTAAVVAILVGAALSVELASPGLAVASGAAFLTAESLDMLVYTPLRKRGWVRAAVPANIVGATVDTAVFISLVVATRAIPGFGWSWSGFLGQWIGKLWITWATVGAVLAVRTLRPKRGESAEVLRDSLDRAGT